MDITLPSFHGNDRRASGSNRIHARRRAGALALTEENSMRTLKIAIPAALFAAALSGSAFAAGNSTNAMASPAPAAAPAATPAAAPAATPDNNAMATTPAKPKKHKAKASASEESKETPAEEATEKEKAKAAEEAKETPAQEAAEKNLHATTVTRPRARARCPQTVRLRITWRRPRTARRRHRNNLYLRSSRHHCRVR